MAIPFAFRVTISHREKAFKLETATRVQKVSSPSAALEGADYAGAWFAIEGPGGRTLYRRGIDNPFDGHEVFTGEKQEMRRVHVPGLPAGLSLLIPEIDGAETLAVYASEPPDREGKAGAAKRVFAVSMRDVAALAAKGGSTHER
jgi:hypothetical protein